MVEKNNTPTEPDKQKKEEIIQAIDKVLELLAKILIRSSSLKKTEPVKNQKETRQPSED